MRHVYSIVLYTLLPFIVLRLWLRSRREPAYRRRLGERFGRYGAAFAADTPRICIHAVSVGEVQAAAPLVRALLERYPRHRLLLTTTTPTGSRRVGELFGNRVDHVYLPWDLPGPVRRFVRALQPELLLLVETEIWPNLLAACSQRGCAIALVSARLSKMSARSYQRIAPLTREALGRFHAIACQTEEDAARFTALGADADAVSVSGSLKFDLDAGGEDAAEALCAQLGLEGRPAWVAASTHAGEDAQVLQAFAALRRQREDALLLLAPRHPNRAAEIDVLCAAAGLRCQRRSGGSPVESHTDVLILDSIGELPLLYRAAQLAFVGGSLVPAGGHNPLEAARWSVPVVSGPHVDNFDEIYRLLQRAGAVEMLEEGAQLGDVVTALMADDARRALMGEAGQTVLRENRGALQRTLAIVDQLLS